MGWSSLDERFFKSLGTALIASFSSLLRIGWRDLSFAFMIGSKPNKDRGATIQFTLPPSSGSESSSVSVGLRNH